MFLSFDVYVCVAAIFTRRVLVARMESEERQLLLLPTRRQEEVRRSDSLHRPCQQDHQLRARTRDDRVVTPSLFFRPTSSL